MAWALTALAIDQREHGVAAKAGAGDLTVEAAGVKGWVAHARALQCQRIPQERVPTVQPLSSTVIPKILGTNAAERPPAMMDVRSICVTIVIVDGCGAADSRILQQAFSNVSRHVTDVLAQHVLLPDARACT